MKTTYLPKSCPVTKEEVTVLGYCCEKLDRSTPAEPLELLDNQVLDECEDAIGVCASYKQANPEICNKGQPGRNFMRSVCMKTCDVCGKKKCR